MSFLKAAWRKLILANYTLAPEVLSPFVPKGTELDTWNGRHYVSLVGFMFLDTRVLGIKVPFHTDFEEVNLRFYVRHKHAGEWRRGVVFIKEIVPRPAISWVANTLYKEHYVTMPMQHRWMLAQDRQEISYCWGQKEDPYRVWVETDPDPQPIAPGSEAEFITEHYWGYTQQGRRSYEYEVTHPRWEQYRVRRHELKADFGALYGAPFAHLNKQKPISVMLAEGSAITVENKRRL